MNIVLQPEIPVLDLSCPFREGDAVYLAKGSYVGATGIFLKLRSDPKWADIRETDDTIREHPVEWIALAKPERTSILP